MPRSVARSLIWAAAFLLALGLQQFLVVCTGPHCASQIELAHAGAACHHPGHDGDMARDAETRDTRDVAGDTVCDCHGDCVDATLDVALAPAPERQGIDAGHLFAPSAALPAAFPRILVGARVRPPMVTGPPRTDPRTARLSSTVLRI